jgi:hypothetical protein
MAIEITSDGEPGIEITGDGMPFGILSGAQGGRTAELGVSATPGREPVEFEMEAG